MPDYRLRQMLAFFGRIVSGHLALKESSIFQGDMLRSNLVRAQLVERMQDNNNLPNHCGRGSAIYSNWSERPGPRSFWTIRSIGSQTARSPPRYCSLSIF